MAVLMQVIISENMRGRGTHEGDPVRNITQVWTTQGELIGEIDPCAPRYDPADGKWISGPACQTKPDLKLVK